MATLANISINLSKINKDKIVTGKSGDKYYDITIAINDQADQYGKDVQAWEKQTKEQREAKENRNFIGSGWVAGKPAPAPKAPQVQPEPEQDEDLPF